jgi:hypothetical protein
MDRLDVAYEKGFLDMSFEDAVRSILVFYGESYDYDHNAFDRLTRIGSAVEDLVRHVNEGCKPSVVIAPRWYREAMELKAKELKAVEKGTLP